MKQICNLYSTRTTLRAFDEATNEYLAGNSEVFVSAAFPSVLILVTLFWWSYSLFEIIGDRVGAANAAWITVVMSTASGWCWLLRRLAVVCSQEKQRRDKYRKSIDNINLVHI